jgi:hypothetical protein
MENRKLAQKALLAHKRRAVLMAAEGNPVRTDREPVHFYGNPQDLADFLHRLSSNFGRVS